MDRLTWDNLCDWLKANSTEELGTDPSSCWVGAYYVISNVENYCLESLGQLDKLYIIQQDETVLKEKHGWVHCFIENNNEMHYFSLLIGKAHLVLVQTYGGRKGLTKKSFFKEEWICSFGKALKGDRQSYSFCFNLPYDKVDEIGLTKLYIFHRETTK